MIDNLLYSINAILPIILLVVLGVFLKRFGKVTDAFCEVADWLVFKIALPVMLFLEVASSTLSENQNGKLIAFIIPAVTGAFIVVSLLTVLFMKDKSKRGAFIQGSCRSNFAILGVPLANNMFGEIGGQTVAIIMPFVILMFNAYSVVILSVFSSKGDHKVNLKSVLKNIITNPLIISVLIGLPFMIWKIPLPVAANKTLNYLSGLCTPLALISLGANFKPENLKGRIGYACGASLIKTILLPALAVTAAALLGLRGPSLGAVLICFGAPSAVSSYIMAKKMDNDHELAAQTLLLSTMICVFTIFVEIFILKSTALI